jgi:deoxycytidine triphosphate deaminase
MKHLASSNSNSRLIRVRDGKEVVGFDEVQVQPNAIDLKVESLMLIDDSTFTIDEEKKQHRESKSVPTKDGYWQLEAGKRYEVIFEGIIDIAEGEAGWVITRSTLNRNGLFLTSGLYDSGYKGVMAGCLHVTSGPAQIKKGTRLGQFILFEAESLSSYNGDYGVDSEHDKKYQDG